MCKYLFGGQLILIVDNFVVIMYEFKNVNALDIFVGVDSLGIFQNSSSGILEHCIAFRMIQKNVEYSITLLLHT